MVADDREHDDPDEPELVPPGTALTGSSIADPSVEAGLARWLEQARHDGRANRAQARELTRTLERVRESHEYVGKALQRDRSRTVLLAVAAVVGPALAALVVWAVWRRTDDVRGDIDRRLESVADVQNDLRTGQMELAQRDVTAVFEARLRSIEGDLERARADAAVARTESEQRRLRVEALTERLEQARVDALDRDERHRRELAAYEGLRADVASLRAQRDTLQQRAGTEAARAGRMEQEIRALEAQLATARARAASASAAPATAGHAPNRSPRPAGTPGTGGPTAIDRSPSPRLPTPSTAPPPALPTDGASRAPEAVERVQDELNRLLALAAGDVLYTVDGLGGVEGDRLLDVKVTGRDRERRAVRTLSAERAFVTVDRAAKQVKIDMADGHLLLGGHQAPFFGGRYSVVVDAEPEAWRVSGLTCLRFE